MFIKKSILEEQAEQHQFGIKPKLNQKKNQNFSSDQNQKSSGHLGMNS